MTTLTLTFAVPNEDFDLFDAIEKVSHDYLMTEEDHKRLELNDGYWTLCDFDNWVSNGFCIPHGFYKVFNPVPNTDIEWDRSLITGEDVLNEYEKAHPEEYTDYSA